MERFLGWQEALELDTYRTVLAELVGTFILVIIGLGACALCVLHRWVRVHRSAFGAQPPLWRRRRGNRAERSK